MGCLYSTAKRLCLSLGVFSSNNMVLEEFSRISSWYDELIKAKEGMDECS